MKKITYLFCFMLFLGFVVNLSAQDNRDVNINAQLDVKNALVPTFTDHTALTSATWTSLQMSPHAVSRSCCAYIRRNDTGYVYQFGGGSGAQFTNVARLNVVTNTWTNGVSTMPFSISSGSAVTYGDSVIFVFGGESAAGLGRTLKYNIITNTWTTLAAMTPSPATDIATSLYHDSLIVVVGGGDGLFGTSAFNVVRIYNIRTNTYSTATALPVAKTMVQSAIWGDTIIVGPGWTTGSTATNVVHKGVINPVTPTTITWSTIAAYPPGAMTRYGMSLVKKGGGVGVVLTGGAVAGATVSSATSMWNFCTATWQVLPNNSLARSNFRGSGPGDSTFYIASGYTTVGVGNTERLTFQLIDGSCGLVGINQNGTTVPTGYSLEQNYPNPFNPSTTFTFGLPKDGIVKLVVSDVLGREVEVVSDGFRKAGSYTVDFDASKLSTGIYFYTLTTSDFVSTKKMMLIK